MNRLVYAAPAADGSRAITLNGRPYGRLMPEASPATLAASPGIQSWSRPGGKTSVVLQDGGASILSFSDYCARHLIPTYPRTTP